MHLFFTHTDKTGHFRVAWNLRKGLMNLGRAEGLALICNGTSCLNEISDTFLNTSHQQGALLTKHKVYRNFIVHHVPGLF